jgi:FtsZ-binding cell division protein ZapB
MNLYEIDSAILDCVDMETGEIFDELKFEELQLTREAKIENICLWIKNLKAEAEALKQEKDAFAQRQKATENKLESLKKYISSYLDGS